MTGVPSVPYSPTGCNTPEGGGSRTQTAAAAPHLDFRRNGAGWDVWCQRSWWPVMEDERGRFCGCCTVAVGERFA